MTPAPDRIPEPADEPAPGTPSAPPPLTVAASLVGIEATVLVLYGLSLVPSLAGQRLAMGVTSVIFLAAYGGFLGWCAWRLWRLQSWARAPVVMAQVIQIPVGISFWGGSTSAVAVVLILVAVVVLAGIFHPASLDALADD